MTNKKSPKSADQLLNENQKLSDRLEKALKELETLKRQQDELKSQVTKRSAELKEANEGLRRDIIEIKRSKTALQESESNLSAVYKTMSEGLAIHKVVYNSSGEAVDYIITDVNPAYEKITGLQKKNISGMMATDAYSVPEAPYIEIYEKVASTGIPTSFETYFPPMMKYFHISVFSPERGKFATMFQDITDQKLSVADMQLTLNRFYNILAGMNNGILLVTNENIIEFINQPFCDIFGLKESPSDLINLTADEMLAKIKDSYQDPEAAFRRISEIVNHGMNVIGEDVTLISKKTLLRDFIPINVDGKLTGRLWNHIDITDRKLAEEELAFQSRLLSEVNDAVFSSDSNFTITYWNQAAEKMFGWTKEEVLGKNSGELLKPIIEGSSRDKERAKLRDAGHWTGEVKYIRKDGTYFFVEVNSTVLKNADGKYIGNVVVAHDITERKRAEDKLKKSEALYRAIGESIDYGIWICDADGKNTYASESYLKLVGLTQEQCSEFGWGDALHPDDAERTIAAWKECSKTGGMWDIEHRFKGVDGEWHPILARGIPIRDDKGNIIMWAGINLDISSIKQAQEDLRRSEEKFRNLVKYAPAVIYEMDIQGSRFMSVNDTMCKILGYSREELFQ